MSRVNHIDSVRHGVVAAARTRPINRRADKAFEKVPSGAQIAVAVRRKGEVRVLTMTPKY